MFDWITWGVWTLGLVILSLWIWVPIQEFRQMRRHMSAARPGETERSSADRLPDADR